MVPRPTSTQHAADSLRLSLLRDLRYSRVRNPKNTTAIALMMSPAKADFLSTLTKTPTPFTIRATGLPTMKQNPARAPRREPHPGWAMRTETKASQGAHDSHSPTFPSVIQFLRVWYRYRQDSGPP